MNLRERLDIVSAGFVAGVFVTMLVLSIGMWLLEHCA